MFGRRPGRGRLMAFLPRNRFGDSGVPRDAQENDVHPSGPASSPAQGDREGCARHFAWPRSRRDILTTRTDELAVTCNTVPIETSTPPTTQSDVPSRSNPI